MVSVYGSRTLTHSAAYVLDHSNDPAIGYPETNSQVGDTTSKVLENEVSVIKMASFTGSHLHLDKEGVLQRRSPFEGVAKNTNFT